MGNWHEVLKEIQKEEQKIKGSTDPTINRNNTVGLALDKIRSKYIRNLQKLTGRNTIAYYSGWLQKPGNARVQINDLDKDAFMLCMHRLDKSKGLDIILHTPGGDLAATESLVDYLHSMFGNDIRAIIPQISMSAGTMIALSCKEIIMGKHSNLGPIDPQISGLACQAILQEFDDAAKQIKANPEYIPLWQVIIQKYHPTFLIQCKHAVDWSERLAEGWLSRNMFATNNPEAKTAIKVFSDHKTQKSHARHISKEDCVKAGLTIRELEEDSKLQNAVLTLHHCYMHTFSMSMTLKIVENHLTARYIEAQPNQQMQFPLTMPMIGQ